MSTHKGDRSVALNPVILAMALALAGICMVGCSTAPYKRGDRAAGSAHVAAAQVQSEKQCLAATLSTLTNLVSQPASDLRPRFEAFSASLDALVAAAKRGDLRATELARSNDVFFASWDRQITNITTVEIRSRSAERRNEVSSQFRTANDHYSQTREQLHSLIDYLLDVRRALSTDLTASGVEAIKPLIAKASETSDTVQDDLEKSQMDLAELSEEMSSSGRADSP